MNPYTIQLLKRLEATRSLSPRQESRPTCPDAILEFFAAMEIPHPGNRAKVMMARAYEMTREEALEAIQRLEASRNARLAHFRGLDAPEIILNNEAAGPNKAIKLLLKRLGSKS